ncbi:hypothetical protein Rs2_46653 [Raphanus sativus]|nr:hypothetical protein Rs2_46653 [Raphanus sativus]
MKLPTTDQWLRKKSTKALVFWIAGFVTRPIRVNRFSSMRSEVLEAGIFTGARRPLPPELEGHFALSVLETLLDMTRLKLVGRNRGVYGSTYGNPRSGRDSEKPRND